MGLPVDFMTKMIANLYLTRTTNVIFKHAFFKVWIIFEPPKQCDIQIRYNALFRWEFGTIIPEDNARC